jgi:hypothetical protein
MELFRRRSSGLCRVGLLVDTKVWEKHTDSIFMYKMEALRSSETSRITARKHMTDDLECAKLKIHSALLTSGAKAVCAMLKVTFKRIAIYLHVTSTQVDTASQPRKPTSNSSSG